MSGSLIRAPDFKEADDPFRLELIRVADVVANYDAEFILKVRGRAGRNLIKHESWFAFVYFRWHCTHETS